MVRLISIIIFKFIWIFYAELTLAVARNVLNFHGEYESCAMSAFQ